MAPALTVQPATPVHLLVLIGGGEFSFGETRAIDEFLLSRMPPDRRTVAFLPTASGSPEYATHIGEYFRSIDASVNTINVPVYRGRDNRRPKNLNMILSAGLVYVGGGVAANLLVTLRESAAEIAMREAAQNGAVVAAIGAAASSFGAYARDARGGAIACLGWLPRTA
ncbi:MAG TPA: Type 1 glutamine amidotransferase-like domain-containing protein, partial [Thermoanaerobaculia bacterium]|nr:Type 1 glutamine amidotransferase-like domain-containing protein [Thermoanaerobaculia bacterium]